MVYLRARYYDPAVGRFLTEDSLIPNPLSSQSWNRYAYAENNPVRYVDPSGHQVGCLVPKMGNGISEPAQCFPEGGGARGAFGSSLDGTGLNPKGIMLAGGTGLLAGGTAAVVANMALDPEVPQLPPGVNLNETPIIPCFEPGVGLGNGTDLLPPVLDTPLDGIFIPTFYGTPLDAGVPPLVSLTASALAEKIAKGHAYDKHVITGGEFPDISSSDEFAELIDDVMTYPDASKPLSRGRHAYWKDDVVVITNPADPDGGTAFRPRDGKAYYNNLR